MEKIRVGIVGYGNLGKGVELALQQSPDFELTGIFTRRAPETMQSVTGNVPFFHIDTAKDYVGKIDVMILCGGSATDIPEQGPHFAAMFNTVDSYDTHAKIPEYHASVDEKARQNGNTSVISTGWDPGLFSLNRMIAEAILPVGKEYTFWGKGVSQGHSDAIRRIEGVKGGVQYTIPMESALERVRAGEDPELSTREKHMRECFVVAEDGADKDKIAETIKTMPNYFDEYETVVHFISEDELKTEHARMPHGGFVIRSGKSGRDSKQIIEFSLKLQSNPEFTASVLVAYARAAYRLNKEGQSGAKTVFDVAPAYLSPKSTAQLMKELL
ncbi:diaminopimelate dehydrogenase [Dethiobacter alkaliphilus]|uniref:diaminopimelate dehydrogenase n=1 Tax=Dethiobacter alkaliphilus TaxID=427926 RepID=UPI002226FE63|nr:diaminopimelate dehydrogenase [Dethiobacter alkaliphilus]MCW3489822.1 diaminopimelate dehydrogenase [Dethiobacter alkaliphilus]